MVQNEIRRTARLLEALVKVEKVPVRELEQQLGLGGGTLNRIFSGRIELKVRHILLVLEALKVRPSAFFRHAFEERTPEAEADSAWILAAVKELLNHEGPPSPDRPTVDVRELIMSTLTELGILPSGKR